MWVEQEAKIGDTVKIEFAEFTNMGTKIGILIGISIDGWRIIDMGRYKIYLDRFTTFLVYYK